MEKFLTACKQFFTKRNTIIVVVIVVALLLLAGFAHGHRRFDGRGMMGGMQGNRSCGQNKNMPKIEDMQKLMEAKDYATFAQLASGTMMGEKINTPELFAQWTEMKSYQEKAAELASGLNLGMGKGMSMMGEGKKMMKGGQRGMMFDRR